MTSRLSITANISRAVRRLVSVEILCLVAFASEQTFAQSMTVLPQNSSGHPEPANLVLEAGSQF